jgi:1-acyl-sn-glycerol-3-phosphate acyltransferase
VVAIRSLSADHFAWRFIRLVADWIVRRHLEPSVEGLEQVPQSGPAIIASRHVHHLYDGCLLLSVIRRPLQIVVAEDWTSSRLSHALLATCCHIAKWPTVLRPQATPRRAPRAGYRHGRLRRAGHIITDVLARGDALLVFPEGFPIFDPLPSPRNPQTALFTFSRGVVDLAWRNQRRLGQSIPLIPTGLEYAASTQRYPSERWPVVVRFGLPVRMDSGNDRDEVMHILESRVGALSGLNILAAQPMAAAQ